jgi:mannose-1-phosphate guanylyltransferase
MKTAIILAGGKGEGLRPVTYELPKPLIPIQGKALIEHVILKLKEAGIKKIYMSVSYMHEHIFTFFKYRDLGVDIDFIMERPAKGTGGCLHMIHAAQREKDFTDNFVVVNGDNLFNISWDKFIATHRKHEAIATVGLTKVNNPSSFGVVEMNGQKIVTFTEKPDEMAADSNIINAGYYIFSPKVFDILPNVHTFSLEKDLFPIFAERGQLYGYQDSGQWFDVGTLERWESAIKNWQK